MPATSVEKINGAIIILIKPEKQLAEGPEVDGPCGVVGLDGRAGDDPECEADEDLPGERQPAARRRDWLGLCHRLRLLPGTHRARAILLERSIGKPACDGVRHDAASATEAVAGILEWSPPRTQLRPCALAS